MTSPENPVTTKSFHGPADNAVDEGGPVTGGAAVAYTGGLRRHEQDAVSLMGGLLLVLVAGAVLLTDLTELSLDSRWVVPAVLLVVGAVGLVATLRPGRTEHTGEGH